MGGRGHTVSNARPELTKRNCEARSAGKEMLVCDNGCSRLRMAFGVCLWNITFHYAKDNWFIIPYLLESDLGTQTP